MAPALITLLTDFGLKDPYVGILKGVILAINPAARVVDICHHVKPGSITQGSILLQEAYPFFPEGTVHVAVVDPGVGSGRRPIVVKAKGHMFVGPDNGIFWPIMAGQENSRVIHLIKAEYFLPEVSATFHGRDIFAPVAGHLSKGVDPGEMGILINDPVQLQQRMPVRKGGLLSGQVVRVDHFGNLITNIHRKRLEQFLENAQPVIKVQNCTIHGIRETYKEATAGEILALIGSSDHLEIAVNLGRACDYLKLNPGCIDGIAVEVSNLRDQGRRT
jgi:S-adenosylmethionine hydrolase